MATLHKKKVTVKKFIKHSTQKYIYIEKRKKI